MALAAATMQALVADPDFDDLTLAERSNLRNWATVLGDRVWHDLNNNGLQDAGEPGLGGVEVALWDDAGPTRVATTTTNLNGNYAFYNVPTGTYYLEFAAPSGFNFAQADRQPAVWPIPAVLRGADPGRGSAPPGCSAR